MPVNRPTRELPNFARRALDYLFPQRQVVVRTEGRLTHKNVSQSTQVAFAVGLVATVGWCAFATVSFVLHDRVIEVKNGHIANARLAYRSLLSEVSEYQNRFQLLTGDLENNHVLMLDLIEQNATLQRNLSNVREELQSTEGQRQQVLHARQNLRTELHSIESQLRELAGRNFSLKGNLVNIETNLQTALGERNIAMLDASVSNRRVQALERELSKIQISQQEVFARLTEETTTTIQDMERVVAMTGLNVDQIIPKDESAQGGPFVSASSATTEAGEELASNIGRLDHLIDRSNNLDQLLRSLPLGIPLDAYSITSQFGKRKDPMNKRWAMHYGMDLGAPYKSKVRATAPGVVSHAGWKGKYGKLVVIDHGFGIKTRFAHLNKVSVKKGQTVDFRDIVGLLGNTGRSTGAHLHYEVIYEGKPVNPMRFVSAGRHVFQVEE